MINFPSFALGYVSGAATVLLLRRFGPAFSELATAGYGVADSLSAMLASGLEDVEDLLAEARARATAERTAPKPPRKAAVLRAVPKAKAATNTRRKTSRKTSRARRERSA